MDDLCRQQVAVFWPLGPVAGSSCTDGPNLIIRQALGLRLSSIKGNIIIWSSPRPHDTALDATLD